MKVKDILEELKNVDPETEVSFQIYEGCCGDVEFLSGAEVDAVKLTDDTYRVSFTFDCLDGYDTCRRAGAVRRFIHTMNIKPKMLDTLNRLLGSKDD